MSKPTITARHDEDATEFRLHTGKVLRRGLDLHGEVTFQVGDHQLALDAVDRLSASLKRQIADAVERIAL